MRGGWKRFGLYVAAVISLVAMVFLATRGEPRTIGLVVAQVIFVGGMAYLLTFLVWPRRRPQERSAEVPNVERAPKRPVADVDRRPVAVIGNRPAGSKPGSEVHYPESPTIRASRGRRPDRRQSTGEIRWPAQR